MRGKSFGAAPKFNVSVSGDSEGAAKKEGKTGEFHKSGISKVKGTQCFQE